MIEKKIISNTYKKIMKGVMNKVNALSFCFVLFFFFAFFFLLFLFWPFFFFFFFFTSLCFGYLKFFIHSKSVKNGESLIESIKEYNQNIKTIKRCSLI